jgi:hypothetical protein
MSHAEIADLVARATAEEAGTAAEDAGRGSRQRALLALVPALARNARTAGFRAVAAGRWLVDEIVELAPRVPVRDAAALRRQFPGLSDADIADRLIRSATRTTAALGAAAGGVAAAEFFSPPALLAAPVQLSAEILAVTSVELKLVAELHEIYGRPATGSLSERSAAYLTSWMRQRAIGPQLGAAGLSAVFGATAKRELRSRVLRKMGRSTTSLAPFLAGAVAGAEVNRRGTKALGESIAAELRGAAQERWFRRI